MNRPGAEAWADEAQGPFILADGFSVLPSRRFFFDQLIRDGVKHVAALQNLARLVGFAALAGIDAGRRQGFGLIPLVAGVL